MEAKSSSSSTMSAASRDTSDPEMPMAIPMSAFLSAGESFTPSPVTATMPPRSWFCDTICSFCSGVVRAKTICLWCRTRSQSSASKGLVSPPSTRPEIWRPSITIALEPEPASALSRRKVLEPPATHLAWHWKAVQTTASLSTMLTWRAIATAVLGWSPVTIMTLMPAALQSSTAWGTASLGGSTRAMRPTKVRLLVGKFISSASKT
mmetsp:Transcript_34993/g.79789  ORF Transcript_34993/g.79789 Transcript_34993/m.79789 type:complete len:207 (+) Transcript_34993:976-1596(+)